MARFDDYGYKGLLHKIGDPRCAGINYIERVWVALANAREPRLWRTSSPVLGVVLCGLLLAFLVLAFAAAFGSGPRGVVPLLPIAGVLLLAPFAAMGSRVVKPLILRRRHPITDEMFVVAAGLEPQADHLVVGSVREALGRIYGIPHDGVLPEDSCRTLRRFNGGGIPYAFEVVLGTRMIMGDQFCTDDPGVDDVLQRVHDEANTVADIVRIMNGVYGRKVSGKGEAPGTPEGGNAQW